jgi:Peptidase family M1 domain
VILLCGYSCATPVAPGYSILKETYDVRFVGPPPELQIHVVYKLENVGKGDLTFMDIEFPNERSFGRKDLHVEIDGHAVMPQDLPAEYQPSQPDTLRIPLEGKWSPKQTRSLSIDYTFEAPQNSGSLITLGQSEFHLGSRGWLPDLEAPKHFLATTPSSANLGIFTVRVPSDFVVLARGTRKGSKKGGSETEYRFLLAGDDLTPFVVAGRYVAAPENSRSGSAVFWTLQPGQTDSASAVAQLSSAWNTLQTDFGPIDKNISIPHIVESPELHGHFADDSGPAAVAFPGGAMVNPAALAQGIASDEFLEAVTHALAHNWFGDEIRPTQDASIGLGEGLPEYATIVIEEARNGEAGRRRRIMQYLKRYDDAAGQASETPLGITMLTDPIGPRRIALAKAPLFYIGLEDICGKAEVRKGLAEVVKLRRGKDVDYNDLRSELEQTTNRSLGQMFRTWLNDRGIPPDFRARYPVAPTGNQETGE